MTSNFSLSGIADQTALLSAHLEFGWAAQYSRCTFKAKLQHGQNSDWGPERSRSRTYFLKFSNDRSLRPSFARTSAGESRSLMGEAGMSNQNRDQQSTVRQEDKV
jgi:hypothetical protein